MSIIEVLPEVREVLRNFELPKEVGFGKIMAPIMIEADYADGKWDLSGLSHTVLLL